ncbi:MAG TPA: nitrite reductase small subunit NirD [Methylomirabilota bacterium]|jgi:nitrite reductase (NADH) small subunit|nr:nitrite reductase small subunit NirD [Methylomirabilota bacterium]
MSAEMTAFEERAERRWANGKTAWRLVDLGPVNFIPLGEGRAYIVNDVTIAVFRQRDGRLFAADNACPHRGGPLADGIVGAGKVICPLHAWKFDLETGRCLGENATIRTYPVQVVNDHIVVAIGPASFAPLQQSNG